MTDPNWSGPGDEISGVVIAVNGNAITIRTDDGKEITLGGKMDPNQALIDARNAIGDFRNAISVPEMERAATKLADTFEALDKWLIKGGIMPADWLPAKFGPARGPDWREEEDADLLRQLHREYPWTAFVPDEEWLKKIEEVRAHPERGLPRPERRKEGKE